MIEKLGLHKGVAVSFLRIGGTVSFELNPLTSTIDLAEEATGVKGDKAQTRRAVLSRDQKADAGIIANNGGVFGVRGISERLKIPDPLEDWVVPIGVWSLSAK